MAIPAVLVKIRDEVSRCQPEGGAPSGAGREVLEAVWAEHAARVRELLPQAHIEGGGEALYLGKLSPGCRTCKDGTWDCLFATVRCNLNCAFCYNPHAISKDFFGSAFGASAQEIAANHAKTDIRGVSFSGGEPFLEAQRLYDWVGWFKSRFPEKYFWAYTNGSLARPMDFVQLGNLGLDEIRFNLAATHYTNPKVLENLSAAVEAIPNVTVEIPAVPEDREVVLGSLEHWDRMGVQFLNLHELIYEPGTNSGEMAGPRREVVMPDGHRCAVHPRSREFTLEIMEYVASHMLELSVNDCSMQSKFRQLRGRQRSMAPVVARAHEKFVDGERYESTCRYDADGQVYFFHPDDLLETRRCHPTDHFVRLARAAPLTVHEPDRWVLFEEI